MKFRLVEENELEKRAKYHRKRQKGLSPFYSPDGGNVPLAINKFNNSVADGANGLSEDWVKRWDWTDSWYNKDFVISKHPDKESYHLEQVYKNGHTKKHFGNYSSLEDAKKAASKYIKESLHENIDYKGCGIVISDSDVFVYKNGKCIGKFDTEEEAREYIDSLNESLNESNESDKEIICIPENLFDEMCRKYHLCGFLSSSDYYDLKTNVVSGIKKSLLINELAYGSNIPFYKAKEFLDKYIDSLHESLNESESSKEYKGYYIDYDFYGDGEYTVQYLGDDVVFQTEDEAKEFIDSLNESLKEELDIKVGDLISVNSLPNYVKSKKDLKSYKDDAYYKVIKIQDPYLICKVDKNVANWFNGSEDKKKIHKSNVSFVVRGNDYILNEDTVKNSDGTWSNKGDEGSHGKFKTKKQADKQRKAIWANWNK